jgi:hypothetical protein
MGLSLNPGKGYIVFGTSSENALGYWMEIEASISAAAGTEVRTLQRVHRNQYGYIVFDIASDGRITKIIDGTVPPDTAPELPSPPSGGGSGGQTGITPSVDVGEMIKQMMEKMMPPMIGMMGMMMMMQMMTGMMSSLSGASAG